MTEKNAITTTEEIAKRLQIRRENYVKVLEALPMPKANVGDFPYANMGQAVRDDFAQLIGGADEAFALLVKGFKTRAWRKAAEKNRNARDLAAEGEIPKPLAKRVAKRVAQINEEVKNAEPTEEASA